MWHTLLILISHLGVHRILKDGLRRHSIAKAMSSAKTPTSPSCCAERNLINSLYRSHNKKKHKKHTKKKVLVVIRIEHGKFKESTPCALCCDAILKCPFISHVVYSTTEGLNLVRRNELKNTYMTRGNRKK